MTRPPHTNWINNSTCRRTITSGQPANQERPNWDTPLDQLIQNGGPCKQTARHHNAPHGRVSGGVYRRFTAGTGNSLMKPGINGRREYAGTTKGTLHDDVDTAAPLNGTEMPQAQEGHTGRGAAPPAIRVQEEDAAHERHLSWPLSPLGGVEETDEAEPRQAHDTATQEAAGDNDCPLPEFMQRIAYPEAPTQKTSMSGGDIHRDDDPSIQAATDQPTQQDMVGTQSFASWPFPTLQLESETAAVYEAAREAGVINHVAPRIEIPTNHQRGGQRLLATRVMTGYWRHWPMVSLYNIRDLHDLSQCRYITTRQPRTMQTL